MNKKSKKNIKRFIEKCAKRCLIMVILVVIVVLITGTLFSKKQIMDKLNYDIVLKEDGSANITETWDIYISHTNTMSRTFEKSSKFGEIENVIVKDLETGETLNKINEKMYHVTTDCYYALDTNSRTFEIAWGTGMEDKIGKKRYQVSYTITDAVNSYKDCEEFYWKLLSKDNGIPVKKVTGTITMPENATNIDNLKAWGHGPLNGKIDITSNNEIEFSVKNLEAGRMLEIRAVTLDDMFKVNDSKIRDYRNLDRIIDEETKDANETNNDTKYLYVTMIIIYAIAVVINILKSVKFYKISKRKNDGIVHTKLKYYRDIPREEKVTPPEASYLYFFKKDNDVLMPHQQDIVAATILDLTLKGYVSLKIENKSICVDILKDDEGLNKDEKAIYEILKGTYKDEGGEFEISKINNFAKKHYSKYRQLINDMVNGARESIYKQGLVDKANKREYAKAVTAKSSYSIIVEIIQFIIIAFLMGLLPVLNRAYISMFGIGFKYNFVVITLIMLPFISTLLVKLKLRSKTQNKIAILTQKGTEEQEQWKALAKFIKEFSMIKEREVPELVIWEKYLVYATAFGIADKAIEQMKAKYPEVFVEEYWEDENNQKYQVLSFATSNIVYNVEGYSPIHTISSNLSRAYSTSLSEIALHSPSSGSGGGGGFSGGGRWPAVAEAGMSRKINNIK